VRHLLLPLLEREFNPSVAESLAELAEIARGEEDLLGERDFRMIGTRSTGRNQNGQRVRGNARPGAVDALQPRVPTTPAGARLAGDECLLDLVWLLSEPLAVQRRAVKAVGDLAGFPLEFKQVEQILRFAAEETNSRKQWSLPLGWKLLREPEALTFLTPDLRTQELIPTDYEYPTPPPRPGHSARGWHHGRSDACEIGAENCGIQSGINLLNPSFGGRNQLAVRNWRRGTDSGRAHKVSEEDQGAAAGTPHHGTERRLWPLWSAATRSSGSADFRVGAPPADPTMPQIAVLIRELPWKSERVSFARGSIWRRHP